MNRCGKYVIELKNRPAIIASASFVGKTESEGPLGKEFDYCFPDDSIGCSTWESAESMLINKAVSGVIAKSGIEKTEVDIILAGDLLNQCTASTYGVRELMIPFAGLFGACSTACYSLALACVLADGGYVKHAVSASSSHFCSAEKQFRYPLEYGSQRPPSAQRTVTGSGAFLVGSMASPRVYVPRILIGRVTDRGISDTSNMGAAMAPAAADSIRSFLADTQTVPADYDMILTGDLGKIGSELLCDILLSEFSVDIRGVHKDCGLLIYDPEKQDVHSGGSGCGCSAAVVASVIMKKLRSGELRRILFAGTGALMSPLISLQGETIPAITHIVEICSEVK